MFTVGEFSRITRVSKRQLRYYDEIGLFKPEHTDSTTKRRYYSVQQMPYLNRILALKDLGLSLEQIQKMLQADISDEEIQGILARKKTEIEQTIHEELQRLRRVEMRLQQNQSTDESPEVVIKAIPKLSYLSVRSIFSTPDALLKRIEQILNTVPEQVTSGTLGAFAGIFYSDDFNSSKNDVELGYFLNKPVDHPVALSQNCILEVKDLAPVATMATCISVGNPDLSLFSFGKIARWIEANGYQIVGAHREIALSHLQVDDLGNVMLETQVPVEHR